jgi:hypothetical protein
MDVFCVCVRPDVKKAGQRDCVFTVVVMPVVAVNVVMVMTRPVYYPSLRRIDPSLRDTYYCCVLLFGIITAVVFITVLHSHVVLRYLC